MVSFTDARVHAAQCGIVLDGCDAVPIQFIVSRSKSGRGAWLAMDVLNPETLEVMYPKGYWLDLDDVLILKHWGIDYVIVEN